MGEKNKKRFPVWLFVVVFVIAVLLPVIRRSFSPTKASLLIPDNAGTACLLTKEGNLVAVFQDGKVAAWDWQNPTPAPLWKFTADSDRIVALDDDRFAAVTKTDRKQFVIYDSTGKKISEISVGWEDQDLWPLQSPDKKVLALACINPDKGGRSLCEFMLFDLARNKPDLSVPLEVETAQKRCIAFAVSNDRKILAVGSASKHGWLAIADLAVGKIILEKEYEQIEEFTGVAFLPDSSRAFLANRDGSVYGIDIASGGIKSTYTVLKPGEKNPVTNDRSSQNIIISADGKFVAAVMYEQKIAVWDVQTGDVVFQTTGGHKLTGSIAFSPDNTLMATSDKRASGSIRIIQISK